MMITYLLPRLQPQDSRRDSRRDSPPPPPVGRAGKQASVPPTQSSTGSQSCIRTWSISEIGARQVAAAGLLPPVQLASCLRARAHLLAVQTVTLPGEPLKFKDSWCGMECKQFSTALAIR
jgi:hypothetical protein